MRGARAATIVCIALGIAGLCVVAYLIRAAGPHRVAEILWAAKPWLPVILALELYQLFSDFFAIRTILGADWRKVPARAWVRSSATAYAFMILVPAGRAAGEVARATILADSLGAPRAATTATQLQAVYLFANGLISLVAAVVVSVAFGARSPLTLLLVGNFVVQTVISSGLVAILWDARVGKLLARLRRRFFPGTADDPPLDAAVRRKVSVPAMLVCFGGRVAQVVQYAFVVRAVGGVLSARGAIVAHGIHLVGSTLGDLVPSQLGVMDGAYRAFAATLGFEADPARALSIPFVIRTAQITIAAACVVVATLTRGAAAPRAAASAPAAARS